MAIAFDAVSSGGGGGTSQTFSHTCTGTNRLLFVGGMNQESSSTITGVTYDGVALTEIDSSSQTNNSVSLWYLIAPSTGANDVVVTRSTSTDALLGVGVSYTGCLQSGVPDSYNTGGAGSGTSLSIATTTVADNCWITGIFRNEVAVNVAGDNTTMRNSSSISMGDTNADQSPAGSHSIGVTWSGSGRNVGVVASFAPAAVKTAKVLVVAGGGGGSAIANSGTGHGGGGGGAGGFVYNGSRTVTFQAYTITVGDGGAGGSSEPAVQGGDSSFHSLDDANGGGYGAGISNAATDGGSGGGATVWNTTPGTGDSGGNDGGNGGGGAWGTGGGGGGAGAVGGNADGSQNAGNGGNGTANSITGSSVTYAGGGGGSGNSSAGTGGTGGGGNGGQAANGSNATDALGGGGGGGGGNGDGGAGGKGIVIVAYTTTEFNHTGGDETGTNGSETWVKFTSDGTLTLLSTTAVVRNLMTLGVGR